MRWRRAPRVDQVSSPGSRPHSYTGDSRRDRAHGSPLLLRRSSSLAMAAARDSPSREVHARAYLYRTRRSPHAEAVGRSGRGRHAHASAAAVDHSSTSPADIGRIDAALFDLAARLEASLDFPEGAFATSPPR